MCAAMALCISAAAISCGNKSNNGGKGDNPGGTKKTEISFLHFDGTATRNGAIKWLEDAAQRFAKEKENEEYESGKKGVKVRVSASKLIPYATLGSDGNDIYLDEAKADMYRYSASNNLLQLDEVINHIKNDEGLTIDPDGEKRLLGAESSDGVRHYYGLPQYEWFNSLTYDVDYFNQEGFYFAKEGATEYKEFNGKMFGTSRFVKAGVSPEKMQKSCGPDGEYGTIDDGLPSSLEEFAKLCEYIKSKGGAPFLIPGGGNIRSCRMAGRNLS